MGRDHFYMLTLDHLIILLKNQPERINFNEVMALIDSLYDFTPTAFLNGALYNSAGDNQGTCKLLAFARLNGFSRRHTLACFGQYYRAVLEKPDGVEHQNIRQFMKTGWDGLRFDGDPLVKAATGWSGC